MLHRSYIVHGIPVRPLTIFAVLGSQRRSSRPQVHQVQQAPRRMPPAALLLTNVLRLLASDTSEARLAVGHYIRLACRHDGDPRPSRATMSMHQPRSWIGPSVLQMLFVSPDVPLASTLAGFFATASLDEGLGQLKHAIVLAYFCRRQPQTATVHSGCRGRHDGEHNLPAPCHVPLRHHSTGLPPRHNIPLLAYKRITR